MLIEINYQLPANGGYIIAQRLIREEDIVAVDPKPDDANKSVLRLKGGGSQFVQSSTDLTLDETYASFKARYAGATSLCRMIDAPAPVQPVSQGGC